ncbi:unnamed protein product [Candidula unifasciata]|uniref:NodB homology domain-containing protein n=1 Tax=Candidula unifasciata TaxID=100452 RepID=A0A8S3ZGK1_9EUPU|nr:unnamed protein product [Candidula unifasciata]
MQTDVTCVLVLLLLRRMNDRISYKFRSACFVFIVMAWQVGMSNSQIESCSQQTCQLPACRCPSHSIPGNLQPENIPQMILIAFDDAVNWDNWQYYLRLFPPDGSRKNPNGCPISATFFVSNNFTDYCMVGKLHARGMEIGDHSVTHKLPRLWWTDADRPAMEYEVLTQRRNLAEKADIPIEEIRGWRSPFLQPAGDDLFSVLHDNNFTYDATMTYSFPKNLYSPVLWPFTLDYGYTLVCNIARCPQKRYPGLWILPVVVVMDHSDQKPCAYVDDCANNPRDKNEAYQMLWKNFLRNYHSNRAPLYLNLHSPWLNTKYQLEAMDEFIQKMVSIDDVYVVTITQALQWQMNPTPLNQLKNFESFKCPKFASNAESKKLCQFTFKHKTAPVAKNTTEEYEVTTQFPSQKSKTPINSKSKLKQGHQNKIKRGPEKPSSSPSNNEKQHDKTVKSEEAFNSHHENDIDEQSSIRHHHNYKTHKPWFLKSTAINFRQSSIFLCLVISVLFLMK